MKKIFRLFPVALAVVALASCSDDNLTAQNGVDSQFKPDPNYLYVTVENDNPMTRAAFVSANVQAKAQASGNDFFRTLYWTNGDKIKLYSEKQNWRPQIWGYDDALTDALPAQYKKDYGFSVFKEDVDVYERDGVKDDQYKDGYGVMPADLSEFTNENRTKLTFNLEGLRYVQFSQEKLVKDEATASQTAEDAADLYYGFGALNVYKSTAPLPLWGVATQNEMKCKWLTGHLCVDLTDYQDNIIPATDDDDVNNYLVIQSADKSLWGIFEAVDFDPDQINLAPVLEATAATHTDIISGTTRIEDLGEDCIVLNLGTEAMKRVIAYAPIMCDLVDPTMVTVKLYTGAASLDFDDADDKNVILTEVADFEPAVLVAETIEAGKLYRIANQDARDIETANTPFSLQQQLTEIDAQMERDYVVTIKNDVLVKTADTEYENMATSVADQHNYVLDLSGVEFKHNVTIQFDGAHGFTNNEVAPGDINYLFIKTKAGKKKVTIDFGDHSTIDAVVVDDNLAGELVLQGDNLGLVENYIEVINFSNNGKLTVADAATKISTSGAMNIDCIGETVKDLYVLNPGADASYTVSLKNGTIEKLTASAAMTSVSAETLGAVQSNVNIASTGISAIKDVVKDGFEEWDTTNHRDKFGFYFSSVWDSADSKFADEASANLSDGKIYTAAQLASIDGATGDYTVMGNIDLSAAKWSTIATASKNFEGANINKNIYESNAATGQYAAAYPSIVGLSNPLFGTLTFAANGYVKNIKFEDVAITSAADRQATVARTLSFAGSVAVTNVDVDGATITGTDVTKAKNYGGLFGLVQATAAASQLFVMNVDIKDVTFTANKYIGGIIGQVENTNAPKVIFGRDAVPADGAAYENVKENTVTGLTINCIKTPNYAADPEYKASGAYLGYFKNNTAANLIAVGATLNYDFTANAIYTNEGRWGTTLPSGAYITFDVVMGQKLFGYADNTTARKATFVTKTSANKFASIVKQSYSKQADGLAASEAGTLLYYVDDNRE